MLLAHKLIPTIIPADSKHVSLSRMKSPESSRSRRGREVSEEAPLLALCLLWNVALLDTPPLELGNSLPLSGLASLSHNIELGLVLRAFSIDDIFRRHPLVHRSYMLLYP